MSSHSRRGGLRQRIDDDEPRATLGAQYLDKRLHVRFHQQVRAVFVDAQSGAQGLSSLWAVVLDIGPDPLAEAPSTFGDEVRDLTLQGLEPAPRYAAHNGGGYVEGEERFPDPDAPNSIATFAKGATCLMSQDIGFGLRISSKGMEANRDRGGVAPLWRRGPGPCPPQRPAAPSAPRIHRRCTQPQAGAP